MGVSDYEKTRGHKESFWGASTVSGKSIRLWGNRSDSFEVNMAVLTELKNIHKNKNKLQYVPNNGFILL